MLNGGVWLATMRSAIDPMFVGRHGSVTDVSLAFHERALAADPELYALAAIADGATIGQQARALFTLLVGSRKNVPDAARALADRVIAVLLAKLPADDVIGVFLAVRRSRANHKHATRAILRWALCDPRADAAIARRRRTVVELVEHALGRDVARACMKHVSSRSPDGDAYLACTVHRLAGGDRARTEARLLALVTGAKSVAIEEAPAVEVADAELPKTVTATNRGDVAATLVHLYRGGESPALRRGLDKYVESAAAKLPVFDGALALIVDASHSTRGYGERTYCTISQSWALRLVLAKRCARLAVYLVGGRGDPPQPEGATDLVEPLLAALAEDPDVVAIVTDGYENRFDGELAGVLAALPAAGIDTPVVIVNSKFTHKDDLALRTPVPAALSIDMWHEQDFGAVLETVGGAARRGVGRTFLHGALVDRLSTLERSQLPWMLRSNPYR